MNDGSNATLKLAPERPGNERGNIATSECRVWMARIRPTGGGKSISSSPLRGGTGCARPPSTTKGSSANSSSTVSRAYGIGSGPETPRSRQPTRTCTSSTRSRPRAMAPASALVIPGVEPIPRSAGTPAATNASWSSNCARLP